MANEEGDFFKCFYYGETKEHKNIIFRLDVTHTKYVIFVLLYSNLINGRNTGKQGAVLSRYSMAFAMSTNSLLTPRCGTFLFSAIYN